MKNKDWNTIQYFKNKLGETYNLQTTFGDIQKDKMVSAIRTHFKLVYSKPSNVIIFPKKNVS